MSDWTTLNYSTPIDNVGVIEISRPDALNAINSTVVAELDGLLASLVDANLHALVLTGGGRAFVAGADIGQMADLTALQAADFARLGQRALNRLEHFPAPTIAAVNGFALGGGCELAMSCHMRVATEAAKFGQPEVNLGLIPGYGGTQRLIQYIGKTKAVELLLTGDMMNAEEALNRGLVNYVVASEEEMLDKAKSLIGKVARKGPVAVAKVIEAVNAYFDAGTDGFDKEVKAFGDTCGTEDFTIGATAFINKEKPKFTGK